MRPAGLPSITRKAPLVSVTRPPRPAAAAIASDPTIA